MACPLPELWFSAGRQDPYGYLDFDQPRIERALNDGAIAAGGCGGGGPGDPKR